MLQLPHETFFETGGKPVEFRELTHEALRLNGSLSLTLNEETIRIEMHPQTNKSEGILLHGHWCAQDFRPLTSGPSGARLFLPFLFTFSRMVINSTEIATLDKTHRSASIFFVNNLFMALGRGCPITCYEDSHLNTMQASYNLQRQYLFALKGAFLDRFFSDHQSSVAMDLIMANAYLPIISFENALLQSGARYLRQMVTRHDGLKSVEYLKAVLQQNRDQMMTHFSN